MDDDFAWVTVDDASGILGSARPKDVAGLLKKSSLWHQLYSGWLATYHPNLSAGWDYLSRVGGRPKLQGRKEYDAWVAALDHDFDAFYAAVGRVKEALDSRTGTSRRLAHLTGRVAGAARDAAQSSYVTAAASAVGAQGLRKAAAGAADRVGKAVGVSGPQSAEAPDMPAVLWACSAEVDSYVAWLDHVCASFESIGGPFAEDAGPIREVVRTIAARRAELRESGTAAAAYWLGYSIDLWELPMPPNVTVLTVFNELHDREAYALYLRLHPALSQVIDSIGSLYEAGVAALAAGDGVVDASQFRLGAMRDGMFTLPDPRWDAEPTDADETAAREMFGRPFSDFVS